MMNNIVSILYGIISVPFLLSYFGKEEYGLIGLALSINVYLQLLDLGMTNANVRFFSEFIAKKENSNIQSLFSLTLFIYIVTGILNSIILIIVSFNLNVLFQLTIDQAIILRNLILILVLNCSFSWISVCFDQMLIASELIHWIKQRNVILKLSQFIFLFICITLNLSINFYFLSYIFSLTLMLPLSIVKVKKIFPSISFHPQFNSSVLKNILPYSLSFLSFGIFQFLAFNFRPLFLANISGANSVADFNIMNTFVLVITMISGSLMQILLPVVTKINVNNDTGSINKIIFGGTKYFTILITILIFSLILVNKEIIILYVGKEYIYLSKWIELWLFTLLLSHRNIMTSFVFTQINLKPVALMGAFAMIIALIIYIMFIPTYGVGGVVLGFLAHELCHTLFYYLYYFPIKLHINSLKIFFKSVIPVWAVIGLAFILTKFITNSTNLDLLSSVILKIIIFILLSIISIFGIILDKNERKFILIKIKQLL